MCIRDRRYYYYGADHPEVYWVHFTGNNVKNILRKYGIVDGVHAVSYTHLDVYKRQLLSDSILTLMEFLYKILFMMSEQVQ